MSLPEITGSSDTARATARAQTPLLTLITQDALESDYATVAARAPAGHRPRRRMRGGTLAGLLAFGMLIAIAAVQTTQQSSVATAGREELIRRVEAQRAALDQIQSDITDMSRSVTRLRALDASLSTQVSGAESNLDRLGAVTGFTAVTGPGVQITIDDATTNGDDGLVRDTDLRLAINGLWNAGAEAVSINGRRLTTVSAPRNSGTTIRLNGTTLSAPYVISAIGNPNSLQADFANSASGLEFIAIAQSLGMGLTIENVDDLALPAAVDKLSTLSYAKAVKSPGREDDVQ